MSLITIKKEIVNLEFLKNILKQHTPLEWSKLIIEYISSEGLLDDNKERTGFSEFSIKNWGKASKNQVPPLQVLEYMSKLCKTDIDNFFKQDSELNIYKNASELKSHLNDIKKFLSPASNNDDTIQIREYEVKASAGKGVENYEVDFKNIPYSKTYLKNMLHISNFSNLCMCEVDGNSMIPTIPEEAKVFFYESENIEIQERKIYVVNYNGELYVKRVTTKPTLMFVSDNTSYPAIQVKENDFYRIVGRVVGYQPKLERI